MAPELLIGDTDQLANAWALDVYRHAQAICLHPVCMRHLEEIVFCGKLGSLKTDTYALTATMRWQLRRAVARGRDRQAAAGPRFHGGPEARHWHDIVQCCLAYAFP